MSDVDDAIARAEARPTMRNPSDYARDCRILAAEVKRLLENEAKIAEVARNMQALIDSYLEAR